MRFQHDDARERPLPDRARPKYDDVCFADCPVTVARVTGPVEHYRTMLAQTVGVDDDRYFGLGLSAEDVSCVHTVNSPDRFGHARCLTCAGHLWCAAWVADGLYSEDTQDWAQHQAYAYAERLPKFRLV